MKDFKIIEEMHLHYCDEKDIYLMLIRDANNFVVEMHSRTEFVGRKTFRGCKDADFLYQTLNLCLGSQLFFSNCKQLIDFAFHYRKLPSIVFALRLSNTTYSLKEQNNLRRQVPFSSLFAYKDATEELAEQPSEIIVTLRGDSKPFGSFLKKDDGEYWFNFSTDY